MTVLAIVDDLLFRSKIEAAAGLAGARCRVGRDASALNGEPPELVIVDLELGRADPLDTVRAIRVAQPALPIVGFCSHVDVPLQQRANEAGCTRVYARSAFVHALPQLVQGFIP